MNTILYSFILILVTTSDILPVFRLPWFLFKCGSCRLYKCLKVPDVLWHSRVYSEKRTSVKSSCFNISVPWHFSRDGIYLPRPFSPPCLSESALWCAKRSCLPYWAERLSRTDRAAGRWGWWWWWPRAFPHAEMNMSAGAPWSWSWRRSEGRPRPPHEYLSSAGGLRQMNIN